MKIAIDGPAGAGKSVTAKAIAKELGFIYVDTGALYRTIGLFVCERGIASDDKAGIISCLPDIKIEMKLENGGGAVYLGGKRIGDEIRTPVISKYASDVSKIPEVRAFLLETQRSIARENNVIMDGRDIGTAVFPNAELKIFMTADPMVRAQRRADEMKAKGMETDIQEVLKNLQERDYIDSHREVSPLTQAEDAIVLDNSNLTMEDQLVWLKNIIKERFEL